MTKKRIKLAIKSLVQESDEETVSDDDPDYGLALGEAIESLEVALSWLEDL
jgi:hypothetical protein